jgi:hypothetical protein
MPTKTKKTAAQKIKKSNAKFEKMTPSQKRVQIAKDVIAQLDAKRLYAKQGVYVQGKGGANNITVGGEGFWDDDTQETEVRDLLAPKCEVCAKGGLFVAAVDRFNKLKFRDELCPIGAYNRCSDPVEYLSRFFGEQQLELIEYAFEKGGAGDVNYDDKKTVAAERFGKMFTSADARMRAIMKNIVKNNGTFEP